MLAVIYTASFGLCCTTIAVDAALQAQPQHRLANPGIIVKCPAALKTRQSGLLREEAISHRSSLRLLRLA